jgi:hypothetical protein
VRKGKKGRRMSDIDKLILAVLTALTCPLALPIVIKEEDDAETDLC